MKLHASAALYLTKTHLKVQAGHQPLALDILRIRTALTKRHFNEFGLKEGPSLRE